MIKILKKEPDYKENEVYLTDITCMFVQDSDTHDPSGEGSVQELRIGKEDGYYVISTDRWAVNELEDLIEVLKEFKKLVK